MINRHHLRNARRRVVPNTQTITLGSRLFGEQQGGAPQAYEVAGARVKRLDETHGRMVAAEMWEAHRVVQVWQEELDAVSAPAPKPDDLLTVEDEDGTEITLLVVSVDRALMGECYNLLSRLSV